MALNKNNPNARGAKQQDKTYNGKPIKPVLYVGNWVGQGKFMAAQTEDGKIIKDSRVNQYLRCFLKKLKHKALLYKELLNGTIIME